MSAAIIHRCLLELTGSCSLTDTELLTQYTTSKDHEALIARPKEIQDSSIPSGNAMAAMGLLRLAALTGSADFRRVAESTLTAAHAVMEQSPISCAQSLLALDFLIGPSQEFAVVGTPDEDETRRVLRAIRRGFRPYSVLAFRNAIGDDGGIALLRGRPRKGGVTTYICQNFVCQEPLVGAEAVEKALSLPST